MATQATVTDPTHPLVGRTLPVLRFTTINRMDHVVLLLPDGQHRVIPRGATDLTADAAAPIAANALPRVSARTLLPLAFQVRALRQAQAYQEAKDDGTHSPAPEPASAEHPAGSGRTSKRTARRRKRPTSSRLASTRTHSSTTNRATDGRTTQSVSHGRKSRSGRSR
jgi:hypothetical protein